MICLVGVMGSNGFGQKELLKTRLKGYYMIGGTEALYPDFIYDIILPLVIQFHHGNDSHHRDLTI